MGELRILPVDGIGEIRPGDDLATVVVAAAPWLAEGDIVVLTSKIVSKAEGCLVRLPSAEPARQAAWDATLAAQTARPVASRGRTRIVRTHGGLVLASAGIDASNVDASTLLVLPVDPDASARSIRAAIRKRAGIDVAVIISDTMGRPWRLGLVDVAIGVAGLRPLVDYRGQRDPYGNELAVTVTAVADELAAATDLVQGKLSRIPVAVVRGLVPDHDDGPGAAALVRPEDEDMFSLGTAEARAEGLRLAAALGADRSEAGEPQLLPVVGERARTRLLALLPDPVPPDAELVLPTTADPADPLICAAAGAAVQRLRAAHHARNRTTIWVPVPVGTVTSIVRVPPGSVPLGVLGSWPSPG